MVPMTVARSPLAPATLWSSTRPTAAWLAVGGTGAEAAGTERQIDVVGVVAERGLEEGEQAVGAGVGAGDAAGGIEDGVGGAGCIDAGRRRQRSPCRR